MSNNLNLDQLATNQASPEVTVNDANAQLDAAITEILDLDLTAADATVTLAQWREHVLFRVIGADGSAVGDTVNLPQGKRGFVLIQSDEANVDPVDVVRGSVTYVIQPGHLYLAYCDGTTDQLIMRDIGGAGEPNDFHIFLPGLMADAQVCIRMNVTRAFTLPINLTGSIATSGVAATATTTITLYKNGVSIGTLVWSAAGTTAAKTFASAVSFDPGDVFSIEGQATADVTAADIAIDLFGTR